MCGRTVITFCRTFNADKKEVYLMRDGVYNEEGKQKAFKINDKI